MKCTLEVMRMKYKSVLDKEVVAKMDKNKKRINLNNQFLEQAVFATGGWIL